MEKIAQRIDAFLTRRLDAYIDETARLCAQPSVSATGQGIPECADMVLRMLERRNFDVRLISTPGAPVVLAHAGGKSDRTLLFYNHYDVQPPDPLDRWTSPPFQPEVRDGALYARGATDDKGELVARLAAIDAVREAHYGVLPCGVTLVIEGQEEVGSPHIAQFVRDNLDRLTCHGSIWEQGFIDPEGRPLTPLGARGILAVELAVETLTTDAHSGSAHMLPSAAWRLVQILNSLKGPDERIRIPGFYDRVRGPSALDLELMDAHPDLEPQLRETYGVREFVCGRTGADLGRAVFEPTCNIQGITAGHQGAGLKTIIPARASAKLDFRLVPDQDPEEIFSGLCAYLEAQGHDSVEVQRHGAMWPARTDPEAPLVALTLSAGEEVYGKPPVLTPLIGGSSPMYAFAGPLGGIPVVTAGVGYLGSRTHAPDEHVRVRDFLNGARHIARILDGFAGL